MIIYRDRYEDFQCPMTWPTGMDAPCQGPLCPVFRWIPMIVDQEYIAAVRRLMDEDNPITGKTYTHAQAAKYVHEHRQEFDLPLETDRGFCGLGPKPEILS